MEPAGDVEFSHEIRSSPSVEEVRTAIWAAFWRRCRLVQPHRRGRDQFCHRNLLAIDPRPCELAHPAAVEILFPGEFKTPLPCPLFQSACRPSRIDSASGGQCSPERQTGYSSFSVGPATLSLSGVAPRLQKRPCNVDFAWGARRIAR